MSGHDCNQQVVEALGCSEDWIDQLCAGVLIINRDGGLVYGPTQRWHAAVELTFFSRRLFVGRGQPVKPRPFSPHEAATGGSN